MRRRGIFRGRGRQRTNGSWRDQRSILEEVIGLNNQNFQYRHIAFNLLSIHDFVNDMSWLETIDMILYKRNTDDRCHKR